MSDTGKSEAPPSWPTLIDDFTQDTSFHGWRYLHTGTQYNIRRFLWLVVVGCCTGLFLWVVYGRVEKYRQHEKNVNVEVESSDKIKFPSVTLCNQNQFRLTKADETGVLDLLEFHFQKDIQGRTLTDPNDYANVSVTNGIQITHDLESLKGQVETFVKVSLPVCSTTCCSEFFRRVCKSIQFDFATKTCTIQPYTTSTPGVNITANANMTYHEVHKCGKPQYTDKFRPVSNADYEISLYDFSLAAAHTKEDMIQGCSFEGKPCSADNFTRTITDYGVCYTFNGAPDRTLTTRQTGSSSGLRIIFNIERDEYLSGPNHDMGLKLYLHEANELAMVRDLGMALDVGKHSYIPVKATILKNEKPPVGKCGSQQLQFSDGYSWFRCVRECETVQTIKTAGCRDIYMAPHATGIPGFCNIDNYTRYLVDEQAETLYDGCKCIEPCERTTFEPSISSIGMKASKLESLLTTNMDKFIEKTRKVKNLRFRVDSEYFQLLAGSVMDVVIGYIDFMFQTKNLTDSFMKEAEASRNLATAIYTQVVEHDLNEVLFGGLTEAKEVVNALMGPLKTSLLSLLERINVQANILVMLVWQSTNLNMTSLHPKINEKSTEVLQLLNDITYAMEIYPAAAYNITFLTEYFQWNVSDLKFFPNSTVQYSACQDTFMMYQNTSTAMQEDIKKMTELINGTVATEAAVQKASAQSMRAIYSFQKFQKAFTANCLDTFDVSVNAYIEKKENIQEELVRRLRLISVSFYYEIEILPIKVAQERILTYGAWVLTWANVTVYNMTHAFGTETTTTMLSQLDDFISKVKTHTSGALKTAFFDYQNSVANAYVEMMTELCNFKGYTSDAFIESKLSQLTILKGLKGSIEDKNMTFIRETPDPVLQSMFSQICKNKSSIPDINAQIKKLTEGAATGLKTDIFSFELNIVQQGSSLQDKIKRMRDMINLLSFSYFSTDENFVGDNFGSLDIFFSELRVQYINQSVAYTISDALSDVGGFMGLLLGASVITVVELVDLFVYNSVRKISYSRKKRSPVTSPVKSVSNFDDREKKHSHLSSSFHS